MMHPAAVLLIAIEYTPGCFLPDKTWKVIIRFLPSEIAGAREIQQVPPLPYAPGRDDKGPQGLKRLREKDILGRAWLQPCRIDLLPLRALEHV
jgi:hypothetical protein